jgi:hypothetical protein
MPQGQVLMRTLLLNLSKFSISLYPTIFTFKELMNSLIHTIILND